MAYGGSLRGVPTAWPRERVWEMARGGLKRAESAMPQVV